MFVIIISTNCPVHPVSSILILKGYCRKVDQYIGVKCSSCVPSSLKRPPYVYAMLRLTSTEWCVCLSY